jgi:hypothetical protein
MWTAKPQARLSSGYQEISYISYASRREFLKTAGQGTFAAGLFMNLPQGAWITTKQHGSTQSFTEERMECDVLVVGGGIAACFAAIKAREQGAKVIMVDKGNPGRSGQSPFATGTLVFNPDWGDKLEDWSHYTQHVSEYLNNCYWTDISIMTPMLAIRRC